MNSRTIAEIRSPAPIAEIAYRTITGHWDKIPRKYENASFRGLSGIKANTVALANPIKTAAVLTKIAMRTLPISLPVSGDVLHLRLDPVVYGVAHYGLAQRLRPALAVVCRHGEGLVDGVGLLVYVVGVDGQGVFT